MVSVECAVHEFDFNRFEPLNNSFKYQLEKGSKKYNCPSCNQKRFVRYVDIETNEQLPE